MAGARHTGASRRPRREVSARRYYALAVQGLEPLAARELAEHGARIVDTLSRFDRREGLVLFEADDIAGAAACRLPEDLFRVLADRPTPRAGNAPAAIARAIAKAPLESALLEHHALAPRRRGRSYRVVARVAGRQPFRREDVEHAVGRAVGALLPHWVPAREAPAIEVWVHVIGERTIIGLRLTPDEFAQRRYKRGHLPASLKPTVAQALVVWSRAEPGDAVLDPMAGAGTILRERTDAAPARLVAGGDSDPEAIAAARSNTGRSAALARWDATRLPIREESVDVIITNPPYGRQHEARGGLERLYQGLLREAARVLRSGGRCIVLTGEPGVLAGVTPRALAVRERHRLLLRGLPTTAFVMVKR